MKNSIVKSLFYLGNPINFYQQKGALNKLKKAILKQNKWRGKNQKASFTLLHNNYMEQHCQKIGYCGD